MGAKSAIQWTDATWNPVRGCTKVSPGCKNCYAETFAERFRGVKGHPFERGFDLRLVPERLEEPLRWRKPRRVFVNSMSDLFHEAVPDDFLDSVFAVMALTPQHTYQILTKRPARMLAYFGDMDERAMGIGASIGDFFDVPSRRKIGEPLINLAHGFDRDAKDWDSGHGEQTLLPLANVWLGVSVENQATADERIPLLMRTPAAVRFLSCEPLLEAVDLTEALTDGVPTKEQIDGPDGAHFIRQGAPRVDWVIVGGESGPGARPCNIEWIRHIVRQCRSVGVPCFVKQLGAKGWHRAQSAADLIAGKRRDSKGADPAEWPEDLRVREYPA